jgi:phosphatidylethanolamine N-methyltransferase
MSGYFEMLKGFSFQNPFISYFNKNLVDKNSFVDLNHPTLYIFLISATFNPLFWNIVARYEYKTKFMTNFFGNKYVGCVFLGCLIFSLGIIRDLLFEVAIYYQPKLSASGYEYLLTILSYGVGSLGFTFVFSSFLRLGFTGTFLGDYFGILMDKRVEGFPFNVLNNPMYVGSTMIFFATSVYHHSLVGLGLTFYVWIVYQVALMFEEPFTARIYSNAKKRGKKRD